MKKQAKLEELTFEAAFARLEQVVGQLEAGDLPLEEALALFEQGQQLAALCGAQLDEAELKVRQLTASGAAAPFNTQEGR